MGWLSLRMERITYETMGKSLSMLDGDFCRVSLILSVTLQPYTESKPHKFIGSPRWTLMDIKKKSRKEDTLECTLEN